MIPILLVEIAAAEHDDAQRRTLEAALLEACSSVLMEGKCADDASEGETSKARAVIVWKADGTATVEVRTDQETSSRRLSFQRSDPWIERYRAAGFTAASLAGDLESNPDSEPSKDQSPRASNFEGAWGFDVAPVFVVRSPLVAWGARGNAEVHLPDSRFGFFLGGELTSGALSGMQTNFSHLDAGALVHLLSSRAPIELTVRGALATQWVGLSEQLVVHDSNTAWTWGGRGSLDMVYPFDRSLHIGVSAGVSSWFESLELRPRGARTEDTGWWDFFAGVKIGGRIPLKFR